MAIPSYPGYYRGPAPKARPAPGRYTPPPNPKIHPKTQARIDAARAPIDPRGDRPGDFVRPLDQRKETAKLQTFLKNRGYNLKIDGVLGPRTQSAMEDWHRGVGKRNPQAWSGKLAPVDPVHTAPTNRNNQPVVTRTNPKTGRTQTQKPEGPQPKAGTQKPVQTGKGRPNAPAAPLSNIGLDNDPSSLFDVDVLANAQMEAKYGPVLAEYLRQERNLKTMADNRVAEIGDMYGQYTKDITTRNQEAAALRGTMAAATEGLAPAIAQGIALDPAAAAELAARGDIESDYAGQMTTSAGDFDRRMASAAQMGGVFAQGQARNEANAGIAELGAERADAVAQRGADLVATRQQLQEWVVDQQMKRQEFALQKAQTAAGIKDAQVKNQIAIAELEAANAMLPLETQKTQAELQKLYADIRRTNADTWATLNPQPTPSDQRQAANDQRAKLKEQREFKLSVMNNMYAQTRHENGQWRVNLEGTWKRAKAALRASGVDPDSPTGKKWLKEYADLNGITLGDRGNPVRRTGTRPKAQPAK